MYWSTQILKDKKLKSNGKNTKIKLRFCIFVVLKKTTYLKKKINTEYNNNPQNDVVPSVG